MKLDFGSPSSSFGIRMGDGTLTPGRVGGAPGLRYRMQFAKGGSVGSASKRADGCAQKGKTKGKVV